MSGLVGYGSSDDEEQSGSEKSSAIEVRNSIDIANDFYANKIDLGFDHHSENFIGLATLRR